MIPPLVTLVLYLPTLCMAQEPPPIKVDVRLVNVSFTVRDASGALVDHLTKDDFEITDDGVPQTITYFSRSADLPLTLGLIVDVSGSQEHFVKQHKQHIETFLKNVLQPRDRAFMVRFGNHLRLASDFTASATELVDGLDGHEKKGHNKEKQREMPEIGPDEHRILGTAFYDAIYYSITRKLARAEGGRKALILFSDGEDNSSAHHMLDAIEAAQSENVVIFSMRYTEVRRGEWNARNKYGMRVMERISRDTGGSDYDAEKVNMEDSFRRIGDELRSSYELAYHSTHPAGDGTFHKLSIRSKRPGLTVRTKTGYFAHD